MKETEIHLSHRELIEKAPIVLATMSSTLYVIGFVVVTSYLATNGINDQSLLNTKYLLAGALVCTTMLGYYFFVWRKIVARVREGISWPSPIGSFLRVFLDTYYVVVDVYACCFVATMLLGLFGYASEYIAVQILLTLPFVFDVVLINTSAYRQYRTSCFVVTFITYSVAVMLYLLFAASHQPLLSLILVLVSFTIIGSVVISSPTWKSGEDRAYGVFYLTLYMLLAVIGFGATVYEYISPKYGGGASTQVSVHLSSEADASIQRAFNEHSGKVYLVLQTDTNSTFRFGDATEDSRYFQVDRKLVKAIQFQPTIKPAGKPIVEQVKDLLSSVLLKHE
jgi:hypothetical protein